MKAYIIKDVVNDVYLSRFNIDEDSIEFITTPLMNNAKLFNDVTTACMVGAGCFEDHAQLIHVNIDVINKGEI